MKVSGFILTSLALLYLYLWRSGQLGAVTPAATVPAQQTTEQRFAKVAP